MDTKFSKRTFRLIELLMLIVIVVILLFLIIPAVNSSREASRRQTCLDNVRQIGQGFQNYATTFNNTFPGSAQLIKSKDGTGYTVGGWSFLIRLGPFMELDYPWTRHGLSGGFGPEDGVSRPAPYGPIIVECNNTQVPQFLCPSGPGRSGVQQPAGITNYKAMGASTRDSLIIVTYPKGKPPYGTASLHPDGAIFPGVGARAADILDGQSHTMFTIETIDQVASRWTVGKEATLVGLPQASSPTNEWPVTKFGFFAPAGFDNTWGPNSAVSKAGLRTFLSYDFSPSGRDAGLYEDAGFSQTSPAYGPSSMHPGVIVEGLGDGSALAVSKQVDAANLFFLITKSNNDPPLCHDE
jgi:competence protein ComGC